MDDEQLAGWSPSGVSIVKALSSVLFQHDAHLNPVKVGGQIRIVLPGEKRPVVQINDVKTKRAVKLKLTIGERSGLISPDGPLTPSTSSIGQSEKDRGLITITLEEADGTVVEYIDQAYCFCSGRPTAPRRRQSVPPAVAPEEGDDTSDDGADHRETVRRQIKPRRGQRQFRNALLDRFERSCAVTGCAVLDVLEAAHIKPYRAGKRDNAADNGLLLRADIHTLFDLDRIGIEPDTLRVKLHPDIARSPEYGSLVGRELSCPGGLPRADALRQRYDQFLQVGENPVRGERPV